jgi:hypothetical protein
MPKTGRPPKWTTDQLEAAIARYVAGCTIAEIDALGVPQTTLLRHLRKRNIPVRAPGRSYGPRSRLYVDKRSGYIRCYAPDHPHLGGRAHVLLEHVRLMELEIGRRLHPDEVVHHRDRNRQNNDMSNLQLMTRAGHTRLHRLEDRSHDTP